MPTNTPATPRDSDPRFGNPSDYANAKMDVQGYPALGNIVELEYESNAGGSWAPDGTSSIRGELLYIETASVHDRLYFVMRDDERSRAVSFPLTTEPVGRHTVRSLTTGKRGRSIGKLVAVTFTDHVENSFAPVIDPLRTVTSGDTLFIGGDEYGVTDAHARGPEKRPYGFRASLVQSDGSEYILDANPGRAEKPTFYVRRGSEIDFEPSSVEVGRLRKRWDDHIKDEDVQREDTTDVFPAPHGAREDERMEFVIEYEEDADVDAERVAGVVTSVRYFSRAESGGLSGIEEKDPETQLELDDGREVVLSDPHGQTRVMVIEPTEDIGESDRYQHGTVRFDE